MEKKGKEERKDKHLLVLIHAYLYLPIQMKIYVAISIIV